MVAATPVVRRRSVNRQGVIAAALLVLMSVMVAASDLPDVWERRVDASGFGKPFLELLPMRDGDVAIASGDRAVSFFAGRAVDRAGDDLGVEPPAAQPYSTMLVDGRHVRRVGPPGCVRRPGVTVALTDAEQHVLQELAWIWIPERPLTLTASECSLTDMPPVTQRAVVLDPKVLALPDGGFLLGDARAGVVVRFDADFRTRSPSLGTRLLAMPAADIRQMVASHAAAGGEGSYDWAGFQQSLEQWVTSQGVAPGAR